MKKSLTSQTRFYLVSAVAVFIGMFSVVGSAQNPEVRGRIGLKDGKSPFGFIQGSNKDAILFALTEGGQGKVYQYSELKGEGLNLAIQIEGGAELLSPGRSAFGNGRFEEAAEEFGKVVKAYPNMIFIPKNFTTEAAWYQIESLRRAGRYAEMAPLVATNAAMTIPTKIEAIYQKQFEFNKLWALYGAKDMAGLKTALQAYAVPREGKEELLPTANYKTDIPENELAQAAFLNAKVAEAEGEKPKALQEYYRAFTLNFGSDPLLSKEAMLAALAIHKEMGDLDNEKNKLPLQQIQGLAFQFKTIYGIEELPSEFAVYAVKPDLPNMKFQPAAAEEEEPAPAPDGEAGEAMKEKGKGEATKGETPKGGAKAPAPAKGKAAK